MPGEASETFGEARGCSGKLREHLVQLMRSSKKYQGKSGVVFRSKTQIREKCAVFMENRPTSGGPLPPFGVSWPSEAISKMAKSEISNLVITIEVH